MKPEANQLKVGTKRKSHIVIDQKLGVKINSVKKSLKLPPANFLSCKKVTRNAQSNDISYRPVKISKLITDNVVNEGFCERESENEGKAEELRQYTCCARYEKMIDVGYGISGEVIQIDAGHCRKLCPRHVSDDPGDASRPAVQKCSSDSHCRARAAKLERVSTLQGVRVIEAIDACECSPESACRRESYTHHVHSGTPHQTVIDVGVCIGHCGKDLGCKPIRNNTISVKGPNGDEIYQVVENCGCAGHCHRMDHMETVLDYSEVPLREGTNTTDVRPVVRQINVGQCVGTCPGNETETCLLRDKKEPSRCLAGLYSKQHTCTPARFKVHEYRIRRGAKREIIQITQCACV